MSQLIDLRLMKVFISYTRSDGRQQAEDLVADLKAQGVGTELNIMNYELIKKRIAEIRPVDNIERFRKDYLYTENLNSIWETNQTELHPTITDFEITGS